MSLESEIKFSLDFLLLLNAENESTVYSPVSLLHSLSMIYVGANNNTALQIADIIGKDRDRQEIIQYYSQLLKKYRAEDTDSVKIDPKTRKRLHTSSGNNGESVNVIIANKLFVSNDTNFLPQYQKIMKNEYGAETEKLNFEDSVTSAKEINNFVCETTKGVIKEIVTPEDIDSSMVAAIINAVYFQGFWDKPFADRRKKKFNSNPVRRIDMMTTSPKDGDWNFRRGTDWKALGIPYKNRKTWLFIILPEKNNGLSDLLKKMDVELFKDVTTRQQSGQLGVTIPIIKTTTTLDLPQHLSKLGIIDAFNDSCDLSNMFSDGRPVKIGKAIHKAVITVDETGTVAAAATAFFPQARSAPGFFAADHPFLYFISTAESSESITPKDILFIGTFC